MIRTESFERVEVASPGELRDWLARNHARAESVWLVTWKKGAPEKYLSTGAVLDELLAWGWIDGVRRKLDETRTMQLISPRRTQRWAKSYKDRVARLRAEGRMAPPGEAAVVVAIASGLWDATAEVDALVTPSDLAAALAARPPARERFAALPPAYLRNVLRWIDLARKPETRARRVAAVVAATAENRRLPQM